MNRKAVLKLTPVAASLLLALGTTVAHAAPAANVLPGAFNTNQTGTAVTYVSSVSNTATINVPSGATVLQWGGSTTSVPTSVTAPAGITTAAGFNIGAGAKLTINNTATGTNAAAVLVQDLTGQASNIYGSLTAAGAGTSNGPTLFVANPNGVVVGASGSITATNGVALIGYAQDPAVYAGSISINNSTVSSKGDVTVAAGASVNAGYLLIAGAGNVNVDVANVTAASAFGIAAGVGASMAPASVSVLGNDVYTTTAVLNLSAASATDLTNATLGAAGAVNVASGTTVTLGTNTAVGGLLTNAGTITTALTSLGGGLSNSGTFTGTALNSLGGDLTNSGTMSVTTGNHTLAVGGGFANTGTFTLDATTGNLQVGGAFSNTASLSATGVTSAIATGGITNSGMLTLGAAAVNFDTGTKAPAAISNSGQINAAGGLTVGSAQSVGSFTNTGILNIGNHQLGVTAGSINLGGVVQATAGTASFASVALEATSGDLTVGTNLTTGAADTYKSDKGSVYLNSTLNDGGNVTVNAANQIVVNGAVNAVGGVTLATANTWTGAYNLGVVIQAGGSVSGTTVAASVANSASNAGSMLQYGGLTASHGFTFTGNSYYQGSGASIAGNATFTYGGVITGGIDPVTKTQGSDPYKNGVVVNGGAAGTVITLDPQNLGTGNQNTNVMGVGATTLAANLGALTPIVANDSAVINSNFVSSNLFARAQGGNLTLSGNAKTVSTTTDDTFYWSGLTYLSTVQSGKLATVDTSAKIQGVAYVSNAIPMVVSGGKGVYMMTGSTMPTNITTNTNSNISVVNPSLVGVTGLTASTPTGTVLTFSTNLPASNLVAFVPPTE